MTSNEEYLDSLLKGTIDTESGNESGMERIAAASNNAKQEENNPDIDNVIIDIPEEEIEEPVIEDPVEIELEEMPKLEKEYGIKDADAELAEINSLLNEHNSDTPSDDDMLALLESVSDKDDVKADHSQTSDDFDIFAMDALDSEEQNFDVDALQDQNNTENVATSENELQDLLEQKTSEEDSINSKKTKKDKKKKKSKKNDPEEGKTGLADGESDEIDNLFKKEEQTQESEIVSENTDKKKNKPGFFKKLLDLLLQEEPEKEEDSKESKDQAVTDNEPKDENMEILEQLEQEDEQEGKGKKKSKKNKKEKKEKPAKKEKKPKKEKPEETIEDAKKLPLTKILPIFIFAVAFLAVVMLVSSTIPENIKKKNARNAYYNQNYEEAYKLLSGYQLSKSDQVIYRKSATILKVSCKIDSAELYLLQGMKLEALDALFQGVDRYGELADIASELGIEGELKTVYDELLTKMMDEFGLSEENIMTVLTYDDNVTYTKILYSVIEGNGIDIFSTVIPDLPVESQNDRDNLDGLDDILGEEEDVLNNVQNSTDEPTISPDQVTIMNEL